MRKVRQPRYTVPTHAAAILKSHFHVKVLERRDDSLTVGGIAQLYGLETGRFGTRCWCQILTVNSRLGDTQYCNTLSFVHVLATSKGKGRSEVGLLGFRSCYTLLGLVLTQ